jgi:hypothetical protein
MKEIKVTRFEAFDGVLFETAHECLTYEGSSPALAKQLANRSAEEIERGLNREDEALSAALEKAGIIVRARRRQAGDFIRHPKKLTAVVPPEPVE